ncbi:sugar transferase [Pseudobacteroides cellulosolvens]|uniref:Exopolysaccharide biosynthesis polyprenyl glycosylphosphotransferase n=1 Tax=Pseudobacteroides cellulosolvens ATCC 35603 = DSM 2933 TaxID=398512 RepID=A0A0L6JMJ2_9FIRM|nr:sugar transferase [Pseudobacteroides cellulosolvens]KNY26602.1 exopolysaccharide biosynthesis polyprenyl glycosylphosphotransferase [Pseudobacteroides cellulosolvens ATCC 35603 = DSM 2933]
MHRANIFSASHIIQAFVDIIVITLTFVISYLITKQYTNLLGIKEYFWILIVYIPVWLFLMGNANIYEKIVFYNYDKILRVVLFSAIISDLFLAAMMFFIKENLFSRGLYVVFCIIIVLTLLIEKFLYKYSAMEKHMNLQRVSRVIIVGTPRVAKKFTEYVERSKININILGYVRAKNKPLKGHTELGVIEDLESIIKDNAVDEVIFALPKDYLGEVEKYVLMCEEMGLTVRMILDLYDLKIAKTYISNVGTLPMLTFDTVSLNQAQLFLKRLMDIVGASIGILLTSIVALFTVAAIKLESLGPAIFAQNRVGLNGRTFKLYKFRSMCVDAEAKKDELQKFNQVEGGLMFKMKNDPRITKVGGFIRKTSIDELPQFLNVLKGEMSLVGTRPPTIDEVSKYENYQRRRISIKPGMTGMWQVSGRSSIMDFDEVVRLDTKYIDEWSIFLDIKIILKTVLVVFKKRGAY